MNVVRSALRRNGFRGISRAAAKVVFAVGTHAEVGGVAIQARLDTGFEGVARRGEGNVLPALKEVSVGLHDRPAGGVERLKKAVVELDRRIGSIGRGKAGRGARDAD